MTENVVWISSPLFIKSRLIRYSFSFFSRWRKTRLASQKVKFEIDFQQNNKVSTSKKRQILSIFSLRTSTRLNCDGRFYRGYNMKLGDTGTILSSQTQDSTRLCLFKFYPSNNCKIRFSCDTFVVSSGYNSGSCPSKVIQSFLCKGGRTAHFQSQSERQGCI